MTRLLFVCTGNTCRSPMAEFVMRHLLETDGLVDSVAVASAGCQATEGKDISKGTKTLLMEQHVPFTPHAATQFAKEHYEHYDYIIGIDKSNTDGIREIVGGDPQGKIHLLMDFAGENRDVNDPFATGDYRKTYEDILLGCKSLLNHIKKNDKSATT